MADKYIQDNATEYGAIYQMSGDEVETFETIFLIMKDNVTDELIDDDQRKLINDLSEYYHLDLTTD